MSSKNSEDNGGETGHIIERDSEAERRRFDLMAATALQASQHATEVAERIGQRLPDYLTDAHWLERAPYESGKKTPTPLDPNRIFIGHEHTMYTTYGHHALNWMLDRLNDTLDQHSIALDKKYYDKIFDEIHNQHDIRMRQSTISYGKFLKAVAEQPSRLTQHKPEIIDKLRAGLTDSSERLKLLVDIPEIGGIEDMKDTAVFDLESYEQNLQYYKESLAEQVQAMGGKIIFRQPSNKPAYTWLDADRTTLMSRDEMVDIVLEGKEIEGMERRSFIALPPELDLPGITPNIQQLPDGSTHNLQLIVGSVYHRLAHRRADEVSDPEEMQEMPLIKSSAEEVWGKSFSSKRD